MIWDVEYGYGIYLEGDNLLNIQGEVDGLYHGVLGGGYRPSSGCYSLGWIH